MNETMSPADIYACTGGNNRSGFGGELGDLIALIIVAGLFGCGGFGGGFGGGSILPWLLGGGFGGGLGGGTAAGYTLASDFANIQRQLSDGFNGIDNALNRQNAGICDLGYTQLSLNNGTNMAILQGNNALQSQIADCCCKTQSGIERVNTGAAMNTAQIIGAIKDCCCDTEKQFMQTQFNAQQYNCATLAAIDKLGDRILDRMTTDKMAEKDARIAELTGYLGNQRLREDIRNDLRPAPVPAYVTCNPWAASYGYGYDNGGCNRCA